MNLGAIAILASVVIIGLVDVFLFIKGGTEATISHIILVWSYNYPIFTFAFGVLCGHFFWRTRDTKETKVLGKSDVDTKEC